MVYVCYLLSADDTMRTYIGITNNLEKRLRQHNGEIKGGAVYTTAWSKKWKPAMVVGDFQTKGEAMRFEWAAKRMSDRRTLNHGLKNRLNRMAQLVCDQEGIKVINCAFTHLISGSWNLPGLINEE